MQFCVGNCGDNLKRVYLKQLGHSYEIAMQPTTGNVSELSNAKYAANKNKNIWLNAIPSRKDYLKRACLKTFGCNYKVVMQPTKSHFSELNNPK